MSDNNNFNFWKDIGIILVIVGQLLYFSTNFGAIQTTVLRNTEVVNMIPDLKVSDAHQQEKIAALIAKVQKLERWREEHNQNDKQTSVDIATLKAKINN